MSKDAWTCINIGRGVDVAAELINFDSPYNLRFSLMWVEPRFSLVERQKRYIDAICSEGFKR